ncbi:MAG: hypothetical protein Q8O38_13115 [Sulfurimicrobium sp.]|nr:hypothetical protein [Sulfurimicrobium sp.]
MTIDPSRFSKLLGEFKLEQLFNELGWDQANLRPQQVVAEGGSYTLTSIAQKRGVVVFRCSPDVGGNIPPRATLLKIEKEATKLAHEHLLVFANAAQTTLTWLWVARVPGQPNTTRTHTWHKGTSGESLRQKLGQIVWALEEEEAITLTDVIKGLRSAFDRDRVSKRFYERFKTEHEAFSAFIDGIDAATDQAWYASLMLNRLMFVYFIQQKGFLDGNPNYLADRMRAVREQAGKGKFHTFYRQFLRRLFHEGLGQHKKARVTDLTKLIGDVPYLNGGLFDVHELEVAHPASTSPTKLSSACLPSSTPTTGTSTTGRCPLAARSTPTCLATSSRSTSTRSKWGRTTPRKTSPSTSARTPSSLICWNRRGNAARSPSTATRRYGHCSRPTPTATFTRP